MCIRIRKRLWTVNFYKVPGRKLQYVLCSLYGESLFMKQDRVSFDNYWGDSEVGGLKKKKVPNKYRSQEKVVRIRGFSQGKKTGGVVNTH